MIDSDGSEQVLHPMANEFNSVLVATDWVGLSSGDRDLIIAEVLENINRVRVVTDRLLQSHANNLALVELTLGPLLEDFVEVSHDEPLLNPDVVHYYGISLEEFKVPVKPHFPRRSLAPCWLFLERAG